MERTLEDNKKNKSIKAATLSVVNAASQTAPRYITERESITRLVHVHDVHDVHNALDDLARSGEVIRGWRGGVRVLITPIKEEKARHAYFE